MRKTRSKQPRRASRRGPEQKKRPPRRPQKKRFAWVPAGRDFRSPFGPEEHLKIRVSRELAWVLPFLERTHKILPRLQMPISIKGYRPAKSRKMRTLGSAYYDDGVINIATHEHLLDRKSGVKRLRGLRRIPKRKILETLAHELAHFHVVDHNFEHAEMTRTIFRTFNVRQTCPHCRGKGSVEAACNPH